MSNVQNIQGKENILEFVKSNKKKFYLVTKYKYKI